LILVTVFESQLASRLPATYHLLRTANLSVHPLVSRIILHGSRGLAGGCRPDSDIDLSLLVDTPAVPAQPGLETVLQEVVETTLHHWQASVEADLAVVFDTRPCGLRCFDQTTWNERLCANGGGAEDGAEDGVDCFGPYSPCQSACFARLIGEGIDTVDDYIIES
jgi:hypothetical protein